MPLRMTGMMSGMDTESIIQQLVEVKKKKVDVKKKAQMRVDYKQEAWKGLNTKLKNLQSKYLSTMRFTDAYSKKVSKISDSSVASVITGERAVNGVQKLRVDKLAQTGYLTGAEVESATGEEMTALTKLSDLRGFEGITEAGSFTLETGGRSIDINVGPDSTISDVLSQLKDAGLNASFDAKNKRLFVSAKESGKDADFKLTAAEGTSGAAALSALGLEIGAGKATKVEGQDAEIYLNDALFTNKNNTFEINGLTITAQNTTKPGESVTITTEQDTNGIYDMVKNFLKEYNAVINEMDKLYNADSAKGYDPLTDEEKDAMSDSEVEKWETKVKDSILRRDENLSTVNSALQSVMAAGIEIGGRKVYLSDFGIETLSYFSAPDNEKHAYHIDGDADDSYTAGNADKLKSMIANDPDTVISFFTKLSQNLYGKMSDMSKSVNGVRTFGSFYDDKKMKEEYNSYTSKIKEMEQKVAAYEDKWYAKFSKMETALAKMQSNVSAVTGLLGG